jgi:hypothetical protein
VNHTWNLLEASDVARTSVRDSLADKRIAPEAVRKIVELEHGDKVLVTTPGNEYARDQAILSGYNLVGGNSYTKEQWSNIREAGAMSSTSEKFRLSAGDAKPVKVTPMMELVGDYAKRVAKRLLGFEIDVQFVRLPHAAFAAQYGNRKLTFMTNMLGKRFFESGISEETTDLIIHELAHEYGYHTEKAYQDAITRIGAQLVMIALDEPDFFKKET